jgi:hypothetical protein
MGLLKSLKKKNADNHRIGEALGMGERTLQIGMET